MQRPEVDMVIRGEAEDIIIELVEALESDRDLGKIGSLSWKRGDREIVHNPLRPVPDAIDRLPFPAHHLLTIDRYTNLQPLTDGLDPNARAYTIITSRGCPYQCIYCSKAITGRTWRPRSPENVLAEWRWLVQDLEATEIGVTDDVMTLDLGRAKDICRGLIDQGLNEVPWITIHGIKAGNTDGELLELMKRAGCKRVWKPWASSSSASRERPRRLWRIPSDWPWNWTQIWPIS
jgi:anaerobic magnesium-protoporphyrin IX monomethyl ester cyclase